MVKASFRSDVLTRRRLPLLAFLALAGYATAIIAYTVHELAHGGAALLTGGGFYDFFVTPLEGSANAPASGDFQHVSTAAGSIVEIGFGIIVWIILRRRIRAASTVTPLLILLWCLATEAILDSIAYMTMQSSVGRMIGLDTGDWLRLSLRWNVPAIPLLVAGLLVTAPVGAALMRDARTIVSALLPERTVRPLFAFWLLILPGSLLLLLYLAALSPWRTTSPLMAIGGILGVPLLGLPAVAWLRWRERRAAAPATAPPARADLHRVPAWIGGFVLFALAVAWAFGPVIEMRRGIAIGSPNPDDYMSVAQHLTLDLDLADRAAPTLSLRSRPLDDAGTPFLRRLSTSLARSGPSRLGASRLAEFIALWNLDEATVTGVTTPAATTGGWTWQATLSALPDSFMVRLWPLTAIRESSIRRLHIHGAPVRVAGPMHEDTSGADFTWTRPQDMAGIDSFSVRLGEVY